MFNVIIILFSLPTFFCIQITNLTDQPLAIIESGHMKIIEGQLKIIHKIDVELLRHSLDIFDKDFTTKSSNSELQTLLILEVTKLKNNLVRITPHNRIKRWDFWGTAIKWIAGNPDADDLRYLEGKIKELSNNNNHQIKINEDFTAKINELTKTMNEITAENQENDANLISTLLNLRTINDQIEAIQDAIVLAKRNIVSHRLLTIEEVKLIANTLERQAIRLQMPEQALEYASTSIGVNQSTILYIITIPLTRKRTYEVLRLEPLIRNNEKVKLPGKLYARGFPEGFLINGPCQKQGSYLICKKREISSMHNNSCIFNLLFNGESFCDYEAAANRETIIEVNAHTILINDGNITLKTQCKHPSQHLTGSFLIQHENCTISLDNQTFVHQTIHTLNLPMVKTWVSPRIRKPLQKKKIEQLNLRNIKETRVKPLSISTSSNFILLLSGLIIFVCVIRFR